jgi:hypothetical protein
MAMAGIPPNWRDIWRDIHPSAQGMPVYRQTGWIFGGLKAQPGKPCSLMYSLLIAIMAKAPRISLMARNHCDGGVGGL